ncbi:hypothetical protein B7492_31935 (plasmid) [Bacillus mycoides]|uniref:Crystaline entomocidal protoxin n=1 Tax=Bacillus mycoides TaxID=1405 RepID=A0A1W6AIP6_BACMY|nr:insecticidal delta-endotoxin Cry8Ea1 family protein [Bacillus mycoides]ARJ25655.1 hypothetical protein B7492_31935 [Bacillus mycoides]
MNSYQNTNEYEVVDASQNYASNLNRYPYANDPIKSIHDVDELSTPSPTFLGTAVGTLLGVFLNYKSLLGSPSISGGIDFLQSIINIILDRNVVNLTIDDVQRLIDQSLDTFTRQQADTRFVSIMNNYNQYLANLRGYINGNVTRIQFVNSIQTNERQLRTELDSFFTLQGRELLLLPNFVQVALLHLSILKDAVVYGGADLVIPTSSEVVQNPLLNRPSSRNYQEALLTSIRIYTNYCIQHYNAGLNRIRSRGNIGRVWLDFNAYRIDMTFKVLDFVMIFPFFNPQQYFASRNATLPVNYELSRVIYTDPVGFRNTTNQGWFAPGSNNTVTFNSIENDIPVPTTSRFLNNIDMFQGSLGVGVNPERTQIWQGNANINSNGTRDIFGLTTGQQRTVSGQSIFRVNSNVHTLDLRQFGVSGADFFHLNGQTSQYRVNSFPPSGVGVASGNTSRFLPGERSSTPTPNDYTHVLSRVANITVGLQPVVSGQRSSVVIHGWTHKSLTRQTAFARDGITVVPAVKGTNLSNCTVVSGPGSTGGDLVRVNANGQFNIQLLLGSVSGFGFNYGLRVRYVCSGSAILDITGAGVTIPILLRNSTTNNLSQNFVYESFLYSDLLTFSTGVVPEMTIRIRNTSQNSNVFIDRIELIPSNLLQNQSLKNTEEIVSNLFANK